MAASHLSSLDQSTLKAFENTAAGHDGALSDESGALFIKPSTTQESIFYQTVAEHHVELRGCLPTFMGTLSLGVPKNVQIESTALKMPQVQSSEPGNPQVHGRKISTDIAVVLENMESRFTRANVIDLKLGSTLCAPDTKPEKAARLDKVASETTTGSLGFRITGMKVWNGQAFDIYDKFYGRKFLAEDVVEGFATFFAPFTNEFEPDYALYMLESIRDEVARIRGILASCETRMFSSSLLIIYEGDIQALRGMMQATTAEDTSTDNTAKELVIENGTLRANHILLNGDNKPTNENDVYDSDDSDSNLDEEEGASAFKMGLVDFAHASFVPGQGSDQNVIKGLRNIEAQMDRLTKRLKTI